MPIHDEELAYLELPLAHVGSENIEPVPVVLRTRFAGKEHEWHGHVVRTEGELDPTTRMVNVVAQVPEPYAVDNGRPPLSVGLFVDAEIEGATLSNLVVLPRAALRGQSRVLVVDDQSRLRFRDVEVLRSANGEIYVSRGLAAGELVCISALQSTAEGMAVRVIEKGPQALAGSPAGDPGS